MAGQIDPQLILATPALFLPGMDDGEWQDQLDLMLCRSLATRDFLDGKLTPDEFEQALDQFGVNPIQAASAWDDGISYL